MFSLPRAQVRSLVGELRSQQPRGTAKKQNKTRQNQKTNTIRCGDFSDRASGVLRDRAGGTPQRWPPQWALEEVPEGCTGKVRCRGEKSDVRGLGDSLSEAPVRNQERSVCLMDREGAGEVSEEREEAAGSDQGGPCTPCQRVWALSPGQGKPTKCSLSWRETWSNLPS